MHHSVGSKKGQNATRVTESLMVYGDMTNA